MRSIDEYQRIIVTAATNGDLAVLKSTFRVSDTMFTEVAIFVAAAHDQVEALDYLCTEHNISEFKPVETNVLYAAVSNGSIHCLSYVYERQLIGKGESHDGGYLVALAAAYGQYDCLVYLVEQAHEPVNETTIRDLFQVSVLKKRKDFSDHRLRSIDYLCDRLRRQTETTANKMSHSILWYAAQAEDMHVIRHLHSRRDFHAITGWDETVVQIAVKHNRILALVFLHQNGCPWDYTARLYASGECLAYLNRHHCPHRITIGGYVVYTGRLPYWN